MFKTNFSRVTLAAAVLAPSLLIAGNAHAAVVTWGYDILSGFTQSVIGGATTNYPALGTSSLSWGTSTGSGQSSLVINNPSIIGGSVDTYIGGVPPAVAPYLGFSTSLTHNNNPITGNSLTSATLRNAVTLTPTVPAGGRCPIRWSISISLFLKHPIPPEPVWWPEARRRVMTSLC